MSSNDNKKPEGKGKRPRLFHLVVGIICLIGVVTIAVTNSLLTQRFTASTATRAEVRLTLYVASLMSELQRNSIVPQLLARDPDLITALQERDYSLSTQRLLSFVDEIGAASLMLLDSNGRTVAATDRNRLGEMHNTLPYFVNATCGNTTIFPVNNREQGGYAFVYSRKVEADGENLGVITVEVDMAKLERGWAGVSDAVLVMDSQGEIILATEPRWRGLMETEALNLQSAPSAIERALRATQDWTAPPVDTYIGGEAVLRREISEREKVEKTLEVAEQTLEQSSKLAALGEMSAAVSHELNPRDRDFAGCR